MSAPATDPIEFVRTNTTVEIPPLVPEIPLHLASEVVPLWQATEADLSAQGLPPPYWAFAWAGGQALARYLLDHAHLVADRRVLDFAAGSGIQAIAAAMAGARQVTASEIDPFASAAIGLNAALNRARITVLNQDLVDTEVADWEVILAGDVCYERPMAGRVAAWLGRLAGAGRLVLMGDPMRSFLPQQGLERLAAYSVKTTRELEDSDVRNAVVWRVTAAVVPRD